MPREAVVVILLIQPKPGHWTGLCQNRKENQNIKEASVWVNIAMLVVRQACHGLPRPTAVLGNASGRSMPRYMSESTASTSSSSSDLTFSVTRTKSRQLPVYSDFKNGRTKQVTILRKIRGDITTLENELQKVCDGAPVVRKMGRLEVKGDHRTTVREWLAGLGF